MRNRTSKSWGTRGQSGSNRTNYWIFIHCFTSGCIRQEVATEGNFDAEVSLEERLRQTEAVLFLSREAVSSKKLAKLAGLADATEARTLIRQLNQQYEQSGCSFRIEEVAGGMTMLTGPQFAPWLRRLAHLPRETKLSQSAMETLAVVAYRQPVLRANIEAIRGVGCSEVLKQLMESELVRICGRSEELGRPYLYGTTKRFLQIFGLRSADRLPRTEWVNAALRSMEPQLESSLEHNPGTSSEAKESTVKMSLSATALIDDLTQDELQDSLLNQRIVRAVEDEDDVEDDFEDDDDEEDDFEDDDDEVVEEAEELDEEFEDEEGEEEDEWEEVDDEDEDEEWDDEDDDDDDWDDDDDDEEEDWD
jgi:segregation and condensation protein B